MVLEMSETRSVWKRYSELLSLHEALTKSFPSFHFSSAFPPKIYSFMPFINKNMGDAEQIEQRRIDLEKYLQGILWSKDDVIKKSKQFKDFFGISEEVERKQTRADWLLLLESTRATLNNLKKSIYSTDGNSDLNARRHLTEASAALGKLEHGLVELQDQMQTDEINRLRNTVAQLKSNRDDLKRVVSTRTVAKPIATSLERAQLLTSGSPGSATPQSSRKFGKSLETQETIGLDAPGLIQLQRSQMKQQDESLEILSSIVQRQKEIGATIGRELDLQNELLEDLDHDVTRVGGRMQSLNKRIDKVQNG